MTNLYIFVYPEKSMIKVGKANNVVKRLVSLGHFGEIDFKESYVVRVPKGVVFGLEGAMHTLLMPYKFSCNSVEGKDGYTELFSIEAMPDALRCLELFSQTHSGIEVQKGIAKPESTKIQKVSRGCDIRRKLEQEHFQEYKDINNVINVFRQIDRMLFALLYYKDRIRYQYDVVDGVVKFRFIAEGVVRRFHKLLDVRKLGVDHSRGGFNTITGVLVKGGLVQLEVPAAAIGGGEGIMGFIAKAWRRSHGLLLSIPERSSLCDEDLPILTWDSFSDAILSN